MPDHVHPNRLQVSNPDLVRDIQRLPNPFRDDPKMIQICLDRWCEDMRAKGWIRGEARARAETAHATVDAIRRLVARGVLSVDIAKAEFHELIMSKAIPEAIGQDALTQLV